MILKKINICSANGSNEESSNESPINDGVQIALTDLKTDRTKRKSLDTLQINWLISHTPFTHKIIDIPSLLENNLELKCMLRIGK